MNLVATIALAASISSTVAFSGLSQISRHSVTALSHQRREVDVLTRRETLESWVVGAAVISTGFLTSPEMALAFPNKISNQYDDRPKQRGSKVCVICTVEVALVDFFGHYRFAINYSLLKFDRSIHSQPKGLGVATRKDMAGEEYLGLSPCGTGEFFF